MPEPAAHASVEAWADEVLDGRRTAPARAGTSGATVDDLPVGMRIGFQFGSGELDPAQIERLRRSSQRAGRVHVAYAIACILALIAAVIGGYALLDPWL